MNEEEIKFFDKRMLGAYKSGMLVQDIFRDITERLSFADLDDEQISFLSYMRDKIKKNFHLKFEDEVDI